MTENISVPWEYVTDGKTREGSNFSHLMQQLLADGYPLDIALPNGGGLRTFTDGTNFRNWFDSLGKDTT